MDLSPVGALKSVMKQNPASLFAQGSITLGNSRFTAGLCRSGKQIFALWGACFPEDAGNENLILHYLEKAAVYGIACGDRLISMAAVFTREIFAQKTGTFIPCGFIVGVCTDKEWRGLGLSGSILRRIQADMAANGWQVLVLSTFIPEFYERFGFEVKGGHCLLTVSSPPAEGSRARLKEVGPAEASALCSCYAGFVQNGFLARSVSDMEWKLQSCGRAYGLYNGRHELIGYALEGEEGFFDEFLADRFELIFEIAAYKGRECTFTLPAGADGFAGNPLMKSWSRQMVFSRGGDPFGEDGFFLPDDW
ncbi:GNAT family N-acetyltransferase [bacterium]|nr:GNAT family N-acetyltransferase [bacterium]